MAKTVAHYRFEEGAGTDVVDSVSGATHGTLNEWHHIAIMRTYLGTGNDYQWQWFIDGVESASHLSTTIAELPLFGGKLRCNEQNCGCRE
ncbi:MAG: hypothetical protein HY717_10345 [Planctomycetes bacterium]|nr:hypothetical protein [Planctomycetota bacterium]